MNSHVRIENQFRPRIATPNAHSALAPVRTLSSANLFQGTKEIAIEHGESVYRLKITRQGKLILNK
ncbi:MAG: hemin uptake protein HemP [Rhizobiaceae bacterium]|nr:hemin uptake protein HemP [Rhizobiaceae bacterium]